MFLYLVLVFVNVHQTDSLGNMPDLLDADIPEVDFVRHYLIESTRPVTASKDANLSQFMVTRSLLHLLVQIKILNIQHSIVRLLSRLTCAESLSALVYAHVLEAGALPCRLRLPAHDMQPSDAMLASLLRVESETDCCVRLPLNRAYAELLPASSSSRTGGTPADATLSRSRRRTTAKEHTHQHPRWNFACLSCAHVPHSNTEGALALSGSTAVVSSNNQTNGHVHSGRAD